MAYSADSDTFDMDEEALVSEANQRQDNKSNGAPLIFGQTLGASPALHDPTKQNVVLSDGAIGVAAVPQQSVESQTVLAVQQSEISVD